MEIDKIYHGDCLELMKGVEGDSVDCIVTDPPYRVTARGNFGNAGGMLRKDIYNKGKVFEHNDIDIEQYLPELYRVLKDGGHCYIMCNHVNLTHFLGVIDSSDFHFVKCLIWNKMNKIQGLFYMNCFEYILFLRKGTAKPINDCGSSDLISIPNVKPKDKRGMNIHDSAKPVPLFQYLIKNSTKQGELVLDPFMGSGTTAIACINTGRHYLGFEIDEKFYDACVKRIRGTYRQGDLFG
jgi:site-specific DNA-methyltransferase (adenine-specific)